MSMTVYAKGHYQSGSSFLLAFASKKEARLWAIQVGARIDKLWAVVEAEKAA